MKRIERRSFELRHPTDSSRILRGRVEGPLETERGHDRPHVILIHGFKGFMDWGFFPVMAHRIAEAGAIAISFNMSGSGIGPDLVTFSDEEAFARDTYTRQLEDLELVCRWIRAGNVTGTDPRRTTLLGHSRGASVALLHAASNTHCPAVIAWAPVAELDRYDDATKAEWRERRFLIVHNARTKQDLRVDVTALDDLERNRERLDVAAACRRLRTPTLFVHGMTDETLDWRETAHLAELVPAELRETLFVANTGHTFGVTHPARLDAHGKLTPEWERVAAASLDWIRQHA